MCNVPLHHYFSTLCASSTACLERPELILVDDNARVSAPSRISSNISSLRKMNRWDSTGCLPRLGNEEPAAVAVSASCDISPSLLKHRKSINSTDSPLTPRLRRCQSDQLFHSVWRNGSSSSKPDQPLRRPIRHSLVEMPNQCQDDSGTAYPQNHYTKSDMEEATMATCIPAKLYHLPYDIPPGSPSDLQQFTTYNGDFDQMVGLDWDDWSHTETKKFKVSSPSPRNETISVARSYFPKLQKQLESFMQNVYVYIHKSPYVSTTIRIYLPWKCVRHLQ